MNLSTSEKWRQPCWLAILVGVMVVALSERWQKVGDMAARTVVVDAPSATST